MSARMGRPPKPANERMRALTIMLEPSAMTEIDKIAKRGNGRRSDVVREAIAAHIEAQRKSKEPA